MKFLVWNVRRLGHSSKKSAVKDLTSKLYPSILALLETKLPEPNFQSLRQVWGRRPSQWVSLPANGASGGIWVVWDLSFFTLNSHFIGEFLVTILLSYISDGTPLKFTVVHGPTSLVTRSRLWFIGKCSCSSTPHLVSGREFQCHPLVPRKKLGSRFTWSNHASNPILSKLDRFLLSLNWEECFPRSSSLALPKPTSDHCPILLDTDVVQRGPGPFRFELHWLLEKDFSLLLHTWRNIPASQVSGRAGYILQTKL
ncbi:hypothetical protein AMTRI_Chr02g257740 [Amborella trichopoda]